MGAYLSQPRTEKVSGSRGGLRGQGQRGGGGAAITRTRSKPRPQESAEGENDLFLYGVASMQGWRTDMVRGFARRRRRSGCR